MAILEALQSATLRLVGQRPLAFFGSGNLLEQELCDYANEVAIDVAQYQDWQALIRFANIVGDGTATAFPLPADYDRQTLASQVRGGSPWAWGYERVTDLNGWQQATLNPGGWTIYDNALQFAPAPYNGALAKFPYITRNIVTDASGTGKRTFTADSDMFVLPERLLTLGVVWRWRENKKLDAAGDQEAFVKALDEYAAKDGGSRIISRRVGACLPGVGTAWPWQLG